MNKKLLDRIEYLFSQRLKQKTGWGKNEVFSAYKDCVIQALAELMDGA